LYYPRPSSLSNGLWYLHQYRHRFIRGECSQRSLSGRFGSREQIYKRFPYAQELPHFDRIFSREIAALPIESIYSEGYVIDTLEASLWCFLNTRSYAEAVLKAVNLGEDTDTTAAVTGGGAGIYYGVESIPVEWLNTIARKEDIVALATHLEAAIYK
jgi:ADP-ribosylglycohydrolase